MINVLLTGAGFTANFGTPIAQDIYEKIVNQAFKQNNIKLLKVLLQDKYLARSDYEKVYEDIFNGDRNESKIFNQIIFDVFINDLDSFCRSPKFDLDSDCSQKDVMQKFLINFFNTGSKSIIFTLNQDLFIERQFEVLTSIHNNQTNHHIANQLLQKGIERDRYIYLKRLGLPDFEHSTQIYDKNFGIRIAQYDSKQEYDEWFNNKTRICPYVKLHGSQDYVDDAGDSIMINGFGKDSKIAKYKLLKEYSEYFNDILENSTCRLIIIGYGFNDVHINSAIIKLLEVDESNIYMINNELLRDFLENLAKKPNFTEELVEKFKYKLGGYLSKGMNSRDLKSTVMNLFLPEIILK